MVGTLVMPRLGTARNPERESLGPFVAHIAKQMGYELHEWQSLLSDVSMELVDRETRFDGQSQRRLNAQYVGCMVGRQSGKSAWCAARIVAQCLLPQFPSVAEMVGVDAIAPQHVAYTAQSRTSAVSRWLEHVHMIRNSDMAEHLLADRHGAGREILEFRNGSTYRPVTPNKTGARGLSLDLAIVDEALAHPLWLLGAMRPTMAQRDSALGCIGSQFVVISNAGDDDSELLNRMQELGCESINDASATRVWMEWSAAPDADPYSEQTWLDTMPTVNQPNGIDISFLREESRMMREDQFVREYLCRRSVATHNQIIPTELWMEGHRADVIVPMDRLVVGLDVRMDRLGASLMACGSVDTYLPVETIECRSGLDWVLDRTVEVCKRWAAPLAIDVGGPAANLIPSLDAAGVSMVFLDSGSIANAASTFYDAVHAKRVCHMNDHRLNDAITGASRRAVGDRWAFDRRGDKDISPLVAASLAMWVVESGSGQRATIY
jgi:hypothetical protein